MKFVKLSFKRWFDIILLSIVAAFVCLLSSTYFDMAGAKLATLINFFRWPSHLILLGGIVSVFWFINIKVGGIRLHDLWSINTLCYPPTWVAMIVGSVFYSWGRHYANTSTHLEVPFDWSAFVVMSTAVLAGITFAGICYLILRDSREPEIKTNHEQLSSGIKKDFDALIESPAGFVEWLHRETPVERPDDDYFDLKVYARRIVGILRTSPLKTIAIVGPYGCGKSSILNMVDFYLLEKEPNKLACKKRKQYVSTCRIITCRVSGWGFHEHKIAEHILVSAVTRLAEEIDCTSLANLPSHYRSAISSSGSTWGKMFSILFDRSSDAMDVLYQIDSVLGAIDKRLVVFIEDLEINLSDDLFWSDTISLLDRLKDLDQVSFVLAIGTTRKAFYSDTLLRVAEHIETVPPLTFRQSLVLIEKFREHVFSSLRIGYLAAQARDKMNERIGLYSAAPRTK